MKKPNLEDFKNKVHISLMNKGEHTGKNKI